MNHFFAFAYFAGDTALWFVFGSVILLLFAPVSNLLPAVPLLGLGCMAADFFSDHRKWLGLIPAVIAVCFCRTLTDCLLLLPAAAYLSVCILKNATQPDSTEYFYRFRIKMAAAAFGGLLTILQGCVWGFQCAVISFTAGVFLMRMQRHTAQELHSKRLIALESALMLTVLAVCLLLSSRMFLQMGLETLRILYDFFMLPILMVLLYVLTSVLWVLDRLLAWLFAGEIDIAIPQNVGEAFGNPMQILAEETGSENPLLTLLLRLAGILIFLFFAWVLFRYLKKGAGQMEHQEGNTDELREILPPDVSDDIRPGLLDRSPEARIRRAYAAYCRNLTRKGIRIIPSDTTRSIRNSADAAPEAEELRQLYLLARYRGTSQLTQTDARRAAALSRQLRSGKD